MIDLLLTAATVGCAIQVMRARRLLLATIWLALTSALVSALLYTLGAPEVAVIELSVGAGLVTVLFVFAFAIIGELTMDELTLVPRPLVFGLALGVIFLLGWFAAPLMIPSTQTATPQPFTLPTFAVALWQDRGLDVLLQIVMIFGAVMGLMGLLSDTRLTLPEPGAEEAAYQAARAAADETSQEVRP
jgi:uncharacterized MnhB-related membrane protein